jgi:glutamate-1-semialdehyde 2,1-aminomutase
MTTAISNTSLDAAYAEAAERFIAANPKSKAIQEQAEKAMPGGNTRTVRHRPSSTGSRRWSGCASPIPEPRPT